MNILNYPRLQTYCLKAKPISDAIGLSSFLAALPLKHYAFSNIIQDLSFVNPVTIDIVSGEECVDGACGWHKYPPPADCIFSIQQSVAGDDNYRKSGTSKKSRALV